MKRVTWILLLAFSLALGTIFFLATRLSQSYSVERSVKTSAQASEIFAVLSDLRNFSKWSPWQKLDPNMKAEYSGPTVGLGSSYSWEGNNEVGAGRMTIVSVTQDRAVGIKLEFFRPFPDTSSTIWQIDEEDAGSMRRITWRMEGTRSGILPKVFHLVMNMDKLIGSDFETGLNSLKTLVETPKNP